MRFNRFDALAIVCYAIAWAVFHAYAIPWWAGLIVVASIIAGSTIQQNRGA